MPTPRAKAGCHGKKRHATAGLADAAKRALQRLSEEAPERLALLSTYWCANCKGWHVGHSNPGSKATKAKYEWAPGRKRW